MKRKRNFPSFGVAGIALVLSFFVAPESALVQEQDSKRPVDTPKIHIVRDVDDISLLESVMFALGWHLAPMAVANVELLHAYDFYTACETASESFDTPARFGPVAVIAPLDDLNGLYGANYRETSDSVELGAQYFSDLRSAIVAFTEQTGITCDSQSILPSTTSDGWLIATDQPIPSVQPTQRLVSGEQTWMATH